MKTRMLALLAAALLVAAPVSAEDTLDATLTWLAGMLPISEEFQAITQRGSDDPMDPSIAGDLRDLMQEMDDLEVPMCAVPQHARMFASMWVMERAIDLPFSELPAKLALMEAVVDLTQEATEQMLQQDCPF